MKLWKREKKIANLFIDHGEAVDRCLAAAAEAVHAYLDGESIDARADEVDRLESEADECRREIRETLYKGAYLPLLREDLYELGAKVDAVANASESTVQFITRQRPEIPDDLRPVFSELVDASMGSIQPLREALETYFKPKGRIKSVKEHVHEVRRGESRSDAVEKVLTERIFGASIPLGQKLHLQQLIMVMAKVADRAENAADRLEQVSLKSLV